MCLAAETTLCVCVCVQTKKTLFLCLLGKWSIRILTPLTDGLVMVHCSCPDMFKLARILALETNMQVCYISFAGTLNYYYLLHVIREHWFLVLLLSSSFVMENVIFILGR